MCKHYECEPRTKVAKRSTFFTRSKFLISSPLLTAVVNGKGSMVEELSRNQRDITRACVGVEQK